MNHLGNAAHDANDGYANETKGKHRSPRPGNTEDFPTICEESKTDGSANDNEL